VALFDPTKKKKKKEVVIQDPANDAVKQLTEKTKSIAVSESRLELIFTDCRSTI
ncbi:hypothetical protein Tco_1222922, partial [Tanacetum coccineum]